MPHPLSTKGTGGRAALLFCLVFYPLAPLLGYLTCLIIRLLSSPLGGSPAEGYLWSAENAAFVREYLYWIAIRWHPILPIVAFYLFAQRLIDCAYIKRARAIGVEIESSWFVPAYFLGFERGATLNELLSSRRQTGN